MLLSWNSSSVPVKSFKEKPFGQEGFFVGRKMKCDWFRWKKDIIVKQIYLLTLDRVGWTNKRTIILDLFLFTFYIYVFYLNLSQLLSQYRGSIWVLSVRFWLRVRVMNQSIWRDATAKNVLVRLLRNTQRSVLSTTDDKLWSKNKIEYNTGFLFLFLFCYAIHHCLCSHQCSYRKSLENLDNSWRYRKLEYSVSWLALSKS